MSEIPDWQDVNYFRNIECGFSDYARFDGDKERRDSEQKAFIDGLEYTPNYDYPRLDYGIEDGSLAELKKRIYDSVVDLEKIKESGALSEEELELYSNFHESRLRRILLVESARSLKNSTSVSDVDINRQCFNKLNIANYGEVDRSLYLGLIATEKGNLTDLNTENQTLQTIRSEVSDLIGGINTDEQMERPLLNDSEMSIFYNYVTSRYSHIFSAVPYTGEDVYYDVDQCVEIMNKALLNGGLSESGWVVIKDSTKSNPTTSSTKNTIYLPTDTKRNASELCRLIIHEQEVHARRAQNSRRYNIRPLEFGTENYADIEEGLGVILECGVTGNFDNSSFRRARNRYLTAGLALGVDGKPRDARETFEIMWRLIALQNSQKVNFESVDVGLAKEQAYAHIENAYRGTQFWMKGVIYTKLKVYYEGLLKNAKYISDRINNLDEAFNQAMIGKYDHTSADEARLVLTILEKSGNITKPE